MWVALVSYVGMVGSLLVLFAEGQATYGSIPIPLLMAGAAIGAAAEWRRIRRGRDS